MGCDIHIQVEKKEDGKWVAIDPDTYGEAFQHRSYAFFGWLGGVRNYSVTKPIAADRGIPQDASDRTKNDHDSWESDAHSASWVGIDELLAVNYDQDIEDRRYTAKVREGLWNGGATCEEGQGSCQTLRKFLGPWYFDDLQILKNAGAQRIVFWFDS